MIPLSEMTYEDVLDRVVYTTLFLFCVFIGVIIFNAIAKIVEYVFGASGVIIFMFILLILLTQVIYNADKN